MIEPSDSVELLVERRATVERDKSNGLYAAKIVEVIVYAIVGSATLAVLYALLKTVVVSGALQAIVP